MKHKVYIYFLKFYVLKLEFSIENYNTICIRIVQ